jgi:hypothetical protein
MEMETVVATATVMVTETTIKTMMIRGM